MQPSPQKHRRLSLGLSLLVFLLLLVAVPFLLVNRVIGKIERVPAAVVTVAPQDESFEVYIVTDSPEQAQNEAGEQGIETPLTPEEVKLSAAQETIEPQNLINILLVGQDARPGQARARSDAMILVSVNPDSMKVSIISFMRDLYVQIPGYSDNRLNAAYCFGDVPLMYDTFETNFGISPDGCFIVRFETLTDVIDILGGVDIELTWTEATYFSNASQDGWNPRGGMNHLNGKQALAYARLRGTDNDFYRTGRQRAVLLAVYEKFRNADINTLLELMDAVLPYLSTDMSNAVITTLALQLLPHLSEMQINAYRVPADGAYYGAMIKGMSVLVPDLELIRSQLENEYLPYGK